MYLDASQLPDGITLKGYDICISGAGAAGIALAMRLAGSSKKVLMICSGSSSDSKPNPNPDPVLESMYEGILGPFMQRVDPIFLTRSRMNMYGGTTNHFAFWARPLAEADFKPRPGYRDAYWPLELAELTDYYLDANTFGHYGPFNYDDIDFWAKVLNGKPFPAQPNDKLCNGIFHSQPSDRITQFQVHYGAQLQQAPNITVLFNATVLRMESTPGKDQVTSLSCSTIANGKPDKRLSIEAKDFVMAQGGIESVRLLKLSGDLADNAQGHLGQGFMLHSVISSAAEITFAEPVPLETRNFFKSQKATLAPPEKAGDPYTPIHVPLFHLGEINKLLTMDAWNVLLPTAETMDSQGIGNFRVMLTFDPDSDGKKAMLSITWEQICNEDSRITLNEGQVDPVFGQPVVNMDWNLLDVDKRTVVKALEICEQYLKARGAISFDILTDLSGGPEHWTFQPPLSSPPLPHNSPQPWIQAGDHHMGATRMSADPQSGIVDPNLKAHAVDNLYILSTSVWPTTGCSNPTLTLVALALRLGDYLQQKP